VERPGELELAAYGEAGERVLAAFPRAGCVEVEAGWEDRWREFHHPVRIGPLWVGPPWIDPPADALAVVVDPGRAFGTGAHATTRLCLQLLLDQPRASLLDLGCGSGVLAISAARLGFGPVIAVDREQPAVEATRANAAANGVAVDTRLADALLGPLPPAELVVANIALAEAKALGGCSSAPRLVTSGYLASDVPDPAGYERRQRRELEGWAADLFERC
jgi:ribosomal protein L11 methyltransferase